MRRLPIRVAALGAIAASIASLSALLLAAPVSPAQASQPTSARPTHKIYFPTQQEWVKLNSTHRADPPFPAIPAAVQGSGNLAYGGGPVQHNPVTYAIFWGSGWSSDTGTSNIIHNYFNDLGGTSFENILTQYYDNSGNINATHTVGGVWVDTSALTTDTTCGGSTVQDSSLQSEVNRAISANGWPRDSSNAVYYVYTPSGYYVNDGTGSCSAPAGNWCAYHNWSSSDSVAYGAMPYPGSGCQVSTSPNGNINGDSEVNLTSHEQFEAITDPQPASGWTDNAGYEIGDKCAWDFSSGTTTLNNGGTFEVQTEYSNASSSCVNSYGTVATPTPTNTPGSTPTPTNTPNPTPTPSNTPTPTPTPQPGSGIVNGGFETGSYSGWTTGGAAHSISTSAHSGSYAALLGSTSPTSGDSTAAQTFTVPSGYGSLSFYYKVVCPDTVTYDWATVTLRDNTTATTTTPLGRTCTNNGSWVKGSAAVTAGHSYTITLVSHDDNYPGDATYTYYDDVALGAAVSNPVVNGGFETGSYSGWTTGGAAHSISTSAHSGSYAALLGSTSPTSGDSTASQTFTIPSGASTLSFYYKVVCPDTVTYDWATVTLRDNTTGTTTTLLARTCTNNGAWVQVSKGVTAGHSVTLTLVSHDDNYPGDATYTYYDDVVVS